MAISELLAGTYVYFGLAGILAAIIGGLWVVSWFSPRLNLSRTVIPIYSLVYGGLIVCGLYFAELPRVSALALAVTPLASLIDRLGFFANLGRSDEEPGETRPQGFAIAAIRVAAMLVPIAVAIIGTIAYGPQRSD